jgi:hypothetical protein
MTTSNASAESTLALTRAPPEFGATAARRCFSQPSAGFAYAINGGLKPEIAC